jgi:hypothetical protein
MIFPMNIDTSIVSLRGHATATPLIFSTASPCGPKIALLMIASRIAK